jgi:hypothetical protein
MRWIFKSEIGLFWIRRQSDGACELGLENFSLGSYASPQQAAEHVNGRMTGHTAWDLARDLPLPRGLDEWEGHE